MAAYAYMKLVIAGDILTNQTWSCSFDFVPAGPLDGADLLTWLTTLPGGSITTWWNTANGIKALNTTTTRLTNLKAYYYDAGATTATSQAAYSSFTPLVGSSTNYLPVQSTICHTKVTALVGRRYRGRVYIPTTAATLNSSHQISSTITSALASSMATMWTDWNNDTVGGGSITQIVGSQLTPTPASVTACRVDSEPDIQRRRADKLFAAATATSNV